MSEPEVSAGTPDSKTTEKNKSSEAISVVGSETSLTGAGKKKKPSKKNKPAEGSPRKKLSGAELFFNREINWIEFDRKVLDEALNTRLPLLEQLKFMAIFYNNLDEFYMVRVANIFRQYRSGVASTSPDGLTPARQLAEIRRRVLALTAKAQEHWSGYLSRQLAEKGVRLVRYSELSAKQRRFLEGYFRSEIYPILTPQAVDGGHPFPMISNVSLNFIVQLQGDDGIRRFARLKCPNNLSRFVFVPRDKEAKNYASLGFAENVRDDDILMMEDLIREHLRDLFPGYRVISSGLFRITRNTDFEIEEDEADDLLEAVKDLVDQRRFGDVVRLEISHGMASELQGFLMKHLMVQPFQVYRIKGPLAFSEMMALYGVDRPGLKERSYHPRVPLACQGSDLFTAIRQNDLFLFHPYDSFSTVLDFVKQASEDPSVIAIKQTLYRVNSNSPIVQSLIEARRRGKQVTAVVELKARFDEERNISWAEEMEKAGINVVYGLVGMKIHAKLCLVVRREGNGMARYVHIGTGNYNASTARMYTDMGILTADPDICADVTDLFNSMTGYARQGKFRQLLVSPSSMRSGLIGCIDAEIERHKAFGDGEIIMKCNQLVDPACIKALYRASQAGVQVHLLIRGICCLRPGLPGISENIEVRSIVGRFLEHARVYWFRNGGEPKVYIGSADLMPRNLDRRVEVVTPVLDRRIAKALYEHILELQLQDNVQSSLLQPDGTYQRICPQPGEEPFSYQEALCHRPSTLDLALPPEGSRKEDDVIQSCPAGQEPEEALDGLLDDQDGEEAAECQEVQETGREENFPNPESSSETEEN